MPLHVHAVGYTHVHRQLRLTSFILCIYYNPTQNESNLMQLDRAIAAAACYARHCIANRFFFLSIAYIDILYIDADRLCIIMLSVMPWALIRFSLAETKRQIGNVCLSLND